MTDDFDELASVYLDGEATPDEVARVEGDPELRARAETLGAMAAEVRSTASPVDPAVRDQHLGAALAVFDELFPAAAGSPTPGGPLPVEVVGARIIHLPEPGPDRDRPDTAGPDGVESAGATVRRIHDRPERMAAPADGRRRRGGTVPAWLSAAAASVAVIGGAAWFATSGFGGDDASETATMAADGTEAGALETTAAASARANGADEGVADEGVAGEDQADAGEESQAELTLEATDDEGGTSRHGADGDSSEEQPSQATTVLSAGPLLVFDAVPDEGDVVQRRVGLELAAPEVSACGPGFVTPAGTELIGFIEAVVDNEPGELLVFAPPGGGPEVVVLVDEGCTPF